MRFLRLLSILICILVIFLGGCSKNYKTSNNEREEAKQTLINYLKAVNENKYDEQLQYLSHWKVNEFEQNRIRWNVIPKYEYMRIVNITPDNSENSKKAYLVNGRGTITKPSKLAIFKVNLEYKLISEGAEPNGDKKVSWGYVLIKEKENDSWKIDDWGY